MRKNVEGEMRDLLTMLYDFDAIMKTLSLESYAH